MNDEAFFPCEIPFRKVKAGDAFDQVRGDVEALLSGSRERKGWGYAVELEGVNTRRYGRQHHPARIAFDSEGDFLRFIGKENEVAQLRDDLALIDTQIPALSEWARAHVRHVIDFAGRWPDLLAVCRYFLGSPTPDLYIRQLPIPVHTKFVEDHQAILRRLLDEILPRETVDSQASRFEERYGLRFDEPLIRLRLLDADLRHRVGAPVTDMSIPIGEIDRLSLQDATVIVTENKMTFLTLPPVSNGVGILGMGKAIGLLRHARWLASCRIFYWGDIDAQGFEILSHFRSCHRHVESLMMDRTTLDDHLQYAVPGNPWASASTEWLDPDETQLFNFVSQKALRLEQERIGHAYSVARLHRAIDRRRGRDS